MLPCFLKGSPLGASPPAATSLEAIPGSIGCPCFATKDAYVRGAKQILAWLQLHGVTGLAAWRLLGKATGGLSASTR